MSKHTITFDQLASWKPCDLSTRKALFASSATLSVSQALNAGATVSDILWVAGKLKLTTECVIFAIRCVEKVGHLNNDPRVQKAINAAKNYVETPTADAADAAARAADEAADEAADDVAYAAARAVRVAYAAARAADAATDEAADVADVAYAAARAVRVAYAAARAADAADVAADVAYAAYAADAATCAETEKFQKDLLIEIFETK